MEGFILVGGASSRMGADKSQLMFGTQTSVERIAAALSTLTNQIRTVGRAGQETAPALSHLIDLHSRWGALGGIHAALQACESEWAAVAACDLPLVTSALFRRLLSLTANSDHGPYDAVVPLQSDNRPQPLCALYRRERCLQKAEELIAAGEHTPRVLLSAIATRWVSSEELSDLPNAEHFFLNVNTPEDYESAKLILAKTEENSSQ